MRRARIGTRRLGAGLAAVVLAALAGCASSPLPEIRRDYAAGRYGAARDRLADLQAEAGGDAHVYALERSVVELALQRPRVAEDVLREARDRLNDLRESSAFDWLSSALLDDRAIPYRGADYEHVLVRALLAVADLVDDASDAAAYALQVLDEQIEIMQAFEAEGRNPKLCYKLVAFGSYVRGMLAEEDPTRLDVARRAYEKVLELEPDFTFAQENLERVTEGVHSPPGHGAVHVIALVGRAPYRVESEEPVTRNVLAIVQWIWAANRRRVTLPNFAPVPVPKLAFHRDNPSHVLVSVDGEPAGRTATVTDVEEIAEREFEAMHDFLVARAALRRAIKIVATEGLKEAVNPKRRGEASQLADLGISVAGLLWASTERADLRCWSLLPAEFQVLRLVLPVGVHDVTLVATEGGAPTGRPQTVRVRVRDGFNTYVVGLAPTTSGGPPPMTSEPVLEPALEAALPEPETRP